MAIAGVALELLTVVGLGILVAVDVILDESPEVIVVGAFVDEILEFITVLVELNAVDAEVLVEGDCVDALVVAIRRKFESESTLAH